MTHEDGMFLDRISGLFVGQLDDDEMKAFDRLCNEGYVERSYAGAAGVMGLARIRRTYKRE